jgi:hypothetical protein
LAPVAVAAGAALASAGALAPRTVGLSMLAVISAAQAHLGLGLAAPGQRTREKS